MPLFEISILKNKKRPRTLVQILSHGGARGVCYVLPTVKNRQMTSSKNQPIIQPEDISAAFFVPLQKRLIENTTMAMYSHAYACTAWVLGTGKLISNSGFFPCLLLSAERQAYGPLVIPNASKIFIEKILTNILVLFSHLAYMSTRSNETKMKRSRIMAHLVA
jgi:hypothetical protein